MIDLTFAFLRDATPTWFRPAAPDGAEIVGLAHIEDTVWEKQGLALRIWKEDGLKAGEQKPGDALPVRCSERHIQRDHSFCIGLRPVDVRDHTSAHCWWDQLRQYIICQSVAARTGVWPHGHALDHGAAGIFHEAALDLAHELDVAREYEAAYNDEPSWITDASLKLLDRNGHPINGRAPCPRGCHYKRRPQSPILRRSCKHRIKFLNLVEHESKRRRALADFWNEERSLGTTCCGTMRNCPLSLAAEK